MTQRRKGHYRQKAPKGAYSNRHGTLWSLRHASDRAPAPSPPPPAATGFMLHGMPIVGLPKAMLVDDLGFIPAVPTRLAPPA